MKGRIPFNHHFCLCGREAFRQYNGSFYACERCIALEQQHFAKGKRAGTKEEKNGRAGRAVSSLINWDENRWVDTRPIAGIGESLLALKI